MPEEVSPDPDRPAEPAVPSPSDKQEDETEAGDFIARNVLDKDSVFFEG